LPAVPPPLERRLERSPWRDVAGMLPSLEKSLSELSHELINHPGQVRIPLQGLRQIVRREE
jgi:predicted trehalose synthase